MFVVICQSNYFGVSLAIQSICQQANTPTTKSPAPEKSPVD